MQNKVTLLQEKVFFLQHGWQTWKMFEGVVFGFFDSKSGWGHTWLIDAFLPQHHHTTKVEFSAVIWSIWRDSAQTEWFCSPANQIPNLPCLTLTMLSNSLSLFSPSFSTFVVIQEKAFLGRAQASQERVVLPSSINLSLTHTSLSFNSPADVHSAFQQAAASRRAPFLSSPLQSTATPLFYYQVNK